MAPDGRPTLRVWRFATLILVALSLGASFGHTLELPAKLQWDGPLYVAVQNEAPGLYVMFGTVGAVIEVGAILAAASLAYLVRARQPAFRLSLVGAGLLLLALISWAVFIAPANSVMSAWTPDTVPADWTYWRNRWEYSHAVNFVLKVAGFGALLASVLAETTPSAASTDTPGSREYATAHR
jgi:hypothetical protein